MTPFKLRIYCSPLLSDSPDRPLCNQSLLQDSLHCLTIHRSSSQGYQCGLTCTISCRYIHDFQSGFDEGLKKHVQLSFMQSDGGLSPVSSFSGHKAILSGPAGGYIPSHAHYLQSFLSKDSDRGRSSGHSLLN